ncbi:MAG: radical SAM protein [Bacillota bacterium]|nr:radical SAM protein [Bacillota bacterium]
MAEGSRNNVGEAMHYTLHLTNDCNMACRYCYVDHDNVMYMDIETAKKAVDIAAEGSSSPTGIIFFGGEPLLCKDVIYETIEYCRWKEAHSDCMFYYKVTTNGLLLDEGFMEMSMKENIFIALSHDGVEESHNLHRLDAGGKGTFEALTGKIDMLLSKRPYAPVLMVVNPDTAGYYSDSVEYLYGKGFRYIICSMNYAANWTEEDMDILKKQYEKLSRFYFERTLKEEKFYLSPFEVKISSHINGDTYHHERCELGRKQISVAPDGSLFPCVQFVGDKTYRIGHIDTGIDRRRQMELFNLNEEEKDTCTDCAVRNRCNHYCGCMNRQATGSIGRVSPVQCAHERLLLPIADKLAERLFRKKSGLFIQKHYNEMFPLLSLIEDKTSDNKKQ